MDISLINWFAVAVAAVSSFVIGGLWYSPVLFEKPWRKAIGRTQEDDAKSNFALTFGLSLVWSIVIAVNLAFFLADAKTTAVWGTIAGVLAGLGWVTMSLFVIGLFERKPLAWMLINGGYVTVSYAVMGLILGAWR